MSHAPIGFWQFNLAFMKSKLGGPNYYQNSIQYDFSYLIVYFAIRLACALIKSSWRLVANSLVKAEKFLPSSDYFFLEDPDSHV